MPVTCYLQIVKYIFPSSCFERSDSFDFFYGKIDIKKTIFEISRHNILRSAHLLFSFFLFNSDHFYITQFRQLLDNIQNCPEPKKRELFLSIHLFICLTRVALMLYESYYLSTRYNSSKHGNSIVNLHLIDISYPALLKATRYWKYILIQFIKANWCGQSHVILVNINFAILEVIIFCQLFIFNSTHYADNYQPEAVRSHLSAVNYAAWVMYIIA